MDGKGRMWFSNSLVNIFFFSAKIVGLARLPFPRKMNEIDI